MTAPLRDLFLCRATAELVQKTEMDCAAGPPGRL
jgi:hypothetical protein